MHEIHYRATMLAREASSREEELVAMKVVELKVQGGAGQACRGPLGQQGVAAPPAARRYSERVFGERRGRRRRERRVECPKISRACGARLLPFCPGRAHLALLARRAFKSYRFDPNRPNFSDNLRVWVLWHDPTIHENVGG